MGQVYYQPHYFANMSEPASEHITCEPTVVIALKTWNGEELDKLTFEKGDEITITKKDGAGWAFGSLKDDSSGWFPLDCVDLPEKEEDSVPDAIGEIGVDTGKTALDAFIEDAQKKKVAPTALKVKDMRHNSLSEFLASRPMREQLVSQNILPSSETTDQVQAAQKRLLEQQQKKHKKKEHAEVLVEKMRQGIEIENPFGLSEEQIDRLVLEVLTEIPVSKQKYHFSSYEDCFSGATLVQHLKASAKKVADKFGSMSNDQAYELARDLVARNILVNIVDSGSSKVKPKHLFQLAGSSADYTIMNLDKIHTEVPENVCKASIEVVAEMVEAMKAHLPDFEALRRSKELRSVGLRFAALQKCSLDSLKKDEKKVFFVNVYNALVMYSHAKLTPPRTAMDRRYMYEYCSVFTNNKRYSIQDLETEALQFGSLEDPLVFFCLSDCTRSTPPVFLFSPEDY